MRTAAGLAPLVIAVVAFEVYCLVEIARRGARHLPRWLWVLICLASIPVGGILYLVIGRPDRHAHPSPDLDGDGAVGGGSLTAEPGPRGARGNPPRRPVARADAPVAVRTEGLTKTYGGRPALDALSLEVPQGSVFGIVGPNGAGKTTLLAILAGIRRPDAGSVVFGVDAAKVAVLPDTPHFEPWLTAREVVDLARTLSAPGSDPANTDDALARAGLSHASDRRSGGFSRGMLQRLGLAATIVSEPDLLLLDEPCSALDPSGRREVLDLVGQLAGEHTVLFCSHILDDVQEVCDRVGVLRQGELLFQGPLDELLVGAAAPTYTVRMRPPLDTVIERLTAQPWIESVEQVGAEELSVRARSVDEAEAGLVQVLADAGAHVVSVVPSGADLERVFLELTR